MDTVHLQNRQQPWSLTYHFVWAPMRAKPCLIRQAAVRLEILLQQKAREINIDLRTIQVLPDRVYLEVSAPPTVAPHRIVCQLKAHTSRVLRQEFREMTTIPTLWTRAYMVLAGEHLTPEQALAAFDAAFSARQSVRRRGRPCIMEATYPNQQGSCPTDAQPVQTRDTSQEYGCDIHA